MALDYGRWRDGDPYDLDALAGIREDEREGLADELCSRADPLDWRDIEALGLLATPRALARIRDVADRQIDGAGALALQQLIGRQGWTEAHEKRLIAMLAGMQSMSGASDRLFDICEAHLTPAVRSQLRTNADVQADPVMRYASGAFLLYLAGWIDSRYAFDAEHRPRLLELNSADAATRQAALAWLDQKIAAPARSRPPAS